MSDGTLPGSPVEVRRQIWHSLVSMLQVYAHAASLNGKAWDVVSGERSAQLNHGSCTLEVSYSADSGAGIWSLTRQQQEIRNGHFQIEADGILSFPGGPKELDAAAIDWVELLAQASTVSNEQLRQPLGIS
jgi:hypothetical protein